MLLISKYNPGNYKVKAIAILSFSLIILVALFSSCKVSYGFSDKASIPDSVKTVRVQYIDNRAPYVNPQLSPNLTDRLRQKIVNQTKLTNTNSENAHWDISGRIEDYSVSTTGVTSTNGQTQASINRLNVRVHITINKQIDGKTEEYDVSRSFDFPSQQSLQTAEASLLEEILRSLTDEIFNKLFSNW
jgi:hypothetical protein